MHVRLFWTALLIPWLASSSYAAPCDSRCRVNTLLDRNVGIALDKPVSLALLRKLGTLRSELTKPRDNPNDPAKADIVHILAFDRLFVRAVVTPQNRVLVEWIELAGPKPPLPYGLKIGASAAAIRAALGDPGTVSTGTVKNGEKLIYASSEQTETVTFVVQDDVLKAVIWDFVAGD